MTPEFLYKNARWPRPGEKLKVGVPYLLSEDTLRGIRVVSVLQSDGLTNVQTIQDIPDTFLDYMAHKRSVNAAKSSVRRNAEGMQEVIYLPHAEAQNLYSKDGDGRDMLDPADPERENRWKKRANDRDFYKLRASEGTV